MAATVTPLRPPTAGDELLRAEFEMRTAQDRLGAAVLRQVELEHLEREAAAVHAAFTKRRKAAGQVVKHLLAALRDTAAWVLLERQRAEADRTGGDR